MIEIHIKFNHLLLLQPPQYRDENVWVLPFGHYLYMLRDFTYITAQRC